ncbi:extensin (Proline-rich glycoprotein) [Novosphingobium sp. Rr 2-17]|uniref:cupin domain-containing protein n=1 Tax=Novosphingobium sp. Rr 2-17 TaxID=555793 RepID=UPI0002698261|nr:cupin domain-containing protein [Novosphingobium sp. Rr 2-17]EIZ77734.1 extensin (Proline-rich glycoprotein) [Novosphingobium sp. Rr 2-17]
MTHSPFAILRPDDLPAYERGNGARTIPLVTPRIGAATFISGITEIPADAAIPFHSHNCEESVVLLSGEAWLDIAEEEHALKAGDATFITANAAHRFRNRSSSAPLRILWIYANAAATRTLVETGETHPVSAEHAR